MALEVSMTGTGTIGNIAPGWSVNESINAVAVGDTGAGTGSVSFSAQATDESLLVINNDTVSTVGDLGTVHGIVQSVSQTGLNASVTHGTIADRFNLDCAVEPVEWGGIKGWLYNMYCAIGIQERQNYLPTIASAGASFPVNYSSMSSDYLYTFRSFIKDSFINIIDDVGGNGVVFNADPPSLDWIFDSGVTTSFLPFMVGAQTGTYGSITPTNSMVLQIKTIVSDSNASRIYLGNSLGAITPNLLAYGNCFTIDINGVALTATITELNTETSQQIDLSGYDLSQPILFTFQVVSSSTGMTIKMYATQYSGATESTSTVFINNGSGTNWQILRDSFEGNVSAINAFTTSITGDLTSSISYFDTEITAPWADINFTDLNASAENARHYGAFPATSGVAWELMQQLAAAQYFEFAISGDTLIARNNGEIPFDITNVGSPPTINPQSTLSGRQINVSYNNAYFINGTIYDAEEDGNNIISVNAGETTVTSVKGNVSPIAVRNPVRSDNWPVADGEYYVIDSAGVTLLAEQWESFGGSVSAEIDPEDNSAIRITVVGPYTDTTLAGGPYELAASDSSVKYAALKLNGTGVYGEENLLGLITGIDPIKYTRATINTINNPFIISQEDAYDRGVWAAQRASGPVVTLSATIPTSSIQGIGLTCGSLISYLDSTYRITTCSIGNISTSITAERYVTVYDIDAIWGTGITVPETFTISIASPAVITCSSHGLSNGDFVSFTTTGELPNNLATSLPIWGGYVINSATNTFQISATQGGSAINSTGSQSGTHSFITGDKSVAEYDALWENYECQDQIIFPYKVA